jgi:hypothetical protein
MKALTITRAVMSQYITTRAVNLITLGALKLMHFAKNTTGKQSLAIALFNLELKNENTTLELLRQGLRILPPAF